jgi:hypothetical protein
MIIITPRGRDVNDLRIITSAVSGFAGLTLACHCEERFLRRGNLEVLDILDYEFASLRSQRQQKDFFSGLLGLCSPVAKI